MTFPSPRSIVSQSDGQQRVDATTPLSLFHAAAILGRSCVLSMTYLTATVAASKVVVASGSPHSLGWRSRIIKHLLDAGVTFGCGLICLESDKVSVVSLSVDELFPEHHQS